MKVIKAPNSIRNNSGKTVIFLAGSIEQGKAEDWQSSAEQMLEGYDAIVLNPRRDDWDPTWEQTEENAQFRKQVKWELKGLGMADHIIFYFQPGTQSPISLLELGAFADNYNTVVVCPKGFWRKGNIDIFCESKDIEVFDTLEDAINEIKTQLERDED